MRTQIRGTHARVRVLALATVALAAASSTGCGDDETATTASAEEAPHFSYSGADGPAKWGSIDDSYALCAEGDEQSPIDLSAAEKGSPTPVSFDYLEAEVELENNGHSVEAVPEPGSTVEIDGTVLELDNFHFHASSEHVVDGKSYPLEFHFVNQAEDGSLAVFGVFVEEGRANPAFDGLTEDVPSEEGGVEQVCGDRQPRKTCCPTTPRMPTAGATRLAHHSALQRGRRLVRLRRSRSRCPQSRSRPSRTPTRTTTAPCRTWRAAR